MSRSSFGPKSLKGPGSISARLTGPIEDAILSALSGGGIPLENVEITGGTIDGVVIGSNNSGPIFVTTIQSGNAAGQGYTVCFYGQSVGDSACWEPVLGRWNIQGDLLVRDISDLGNLRVAVNTLSSTNVNGNIIIDPNGTGIINLIGPLSQTTNSGNITLNTLSGLYSLNTSSTVTSTSGTDTLIRTTNGDITLKTGLNITPKNINFITTGTNPTITTTSVHNLEVGDTVEISGSNSVPNINGRHLVTDVPSTVSFRILLTSPVTGSGTTGSVIQHNDIYLTATNNVNIPQDIPLTFGKDTQNIKGIANGNLVLSSANSIDLIPTTSVTVPQSVPIIFGNSTRSIRNTANDLVIANSTVGGKVLINSNAVVNGDLLVNGERTEVESTIVVIKDPVFTLGGQTPPTTDDNKDRGIEFRYHTGTEARVGFFGLKDSTGCFTYIPNATNNNEVFTGTPGCAEFGSIKATGLDLQGGSLNVCNLFCPSTMTITGSTAMNLVSPNINTSSNLTTTGTLTSNGNVVVNGTTSTFNSTNVLFNDRILTVGGTTTLTSNDNKDRGIEFRYYSDGSSKLGFFGWDESTQCFSLFINATNTNDIVTGTLGNACFNTGTFSQINTCNINCSGTLTLTGANEIVLSSPNVTTTGALTTTGILTSNGNLVVNGTTSTFNSTNVLFNDRILTIGGTTALSSDDNKDRGIEFRYYSDGTSKLGFFGWDDSENCFTFLTDATNTNDTITGTLADVCVGNLKVNNSITGPGIHTIFTKEHLVSSGPPISPSTEINMTFIKITTTGTVTGTLPVGPVDGYQKHILISSISPGGKYVLSCPSGRLMDPGSGTTAAKSLTFEYSGQSIFLIWDAVESYYIIVNGGACIS